MGPCQSNEAKTEYPILYKFCFTTYRSYESNKKISEEINYCLEKGGSPFTENSCRLVFSVTRKLCFIKENEVRAEGLSLGKKKNSFYLANLLKLDK